MTITLDSSLSTTTRRNASGVTEEVVVLSTDVGQDTQAIAVAGVDAAGVLRAAGVDNENRLQVRPVRDITPSGAPTTVSAVTYGADAQVGAPAKVTGPDVTGRSLALGMYDVDCSILDIGGLVGSDPFVVLFGADPTADLGGDGADWEALAALASFKGIVTGFTKVPLSTSGTAAAFVGGTARCALSGDLWAVVVGGSGATATGDETLVIAPAFTLDATTLDV